MIYEQPTWPLATITVDGYEIPKERRLCQNQAAGADGGEKANQGEKNGFALEDTIGEALRTGGPSRGF